MNVTIEASIGVGKSTLLRNLKEILEQSEFSTSVFPEPTDSWVSPCVGSTKKRGVV